MRENSNETTIVYNWRTDELMNLPIGKYKVVLDLKNDDVLVTNQRMKKGWEILTNINVQTTTKKERETVGREIKHIVNDLEKVCKTTIVKTYGKDIADEAPVWRRVDNPYYKCSEPMCLYFVKSIEYLYGMGQWKNKRENKSWAA